MFITPEYVISLDTKLQRYVLQEVIFSRSYKIMPRLTTTIEISQILQRPPQILEAENDQFLNLLFTKAIELVYCIAKLAPRNFGELAKFENVTRHQLCSLTEQFLIMLYTYLINLFLCELSLIASFQHARGQSDPRSNYIIEDTRYLNETRGFLVSLSNRGFIFWKVDRS